MKRTALTLVAAAAAVSLAACGSSGSSQSGGGSSSAAGGTGSAAGGGSSNTIAGKLVFGGPPEFETRVDGLPGLQKNYGIKFKSFRALDTAGPLTVNALKNGQVQAADLFTTDPSIQQDGFVVLQDPKSNFAAQNVVPLINKSKATAGVATVLNAVSAKLDTTTLGQLDEKVQSEKQDPTQVADQWLAGAGLPSTKPAAGVSLTVGSANFPENVLLAEIYAEALKAAGANVSTKLNIGSREVYIPAIEQGSIDLIPEYSGNLLQFIDKTATATSSDDVYAALKTAVPSQLTVLDQASAQDKDAVVVTKDTASKYSLSSIADLAKPAS